MAVVGMASSTGLVRMSPWVSVRKIGIFCAADGVGCSGTTVSVSSGCARPASGVHVVATPVRDARISQSGNQKVSIGSLWKEQNNPKNKCRNVTSRAVSSETFWITALQAAGLAALMALGAVIAGVILQAGLERRAIEEVEEIERLQAEGLLSDQFEQEITEVEDQLSVPRSRNRPVREE